jgi:hypothetical protein
MAMPRAKLLSPLQGWKKRGKICIARAFKLGQWWKFNRRTFYLIQSRDYAFDGK